MKCRAIPYKGQEPYVFISYCHKDSARVYPLLEQMAQDGCRIWYDDGNHAGDDWLENIENHVEDSSVFVAFISASSSLSHNCKSEVTYALGCRKPVIPVVLDNAPMPKGLRMQLSFLHQLNSTEYPSDQALLHQIYEAEVMKACRGGAQALKQDLSGAGSSASCGNAVSRDAGSGSNAGKKAESGSSARGGNAFFQDSGSGAGKKAESGSLVISGNASSAHSQSTEQKPQEDNSGLQDEATLRSGTGLGEDETTRDGKARPGDEQTIKGGRSAGRRGMSLLVHVFGKQVYLLQKPQTKLGRSDTQCDVVLSGNNSVSNFHAQIIQSQNKCVLCDANSSNGTYLYGERLEPNEPKELRETDTFQLNDEIMVFIGGTKARKVFQQGKVHLLLNEALPESCILSEESLALNRDHKWPGGTLSDRKIHREAHRPGHARIDRDGDGFLVTDESGFDGNGTYVNGRQLPPKESRRLKPGDQIRLGDTILEYLCFEI